jgi:hypothetical protein
VLLIIVINIPFRHLTGHFSQDSRCAGRIPNEELSRMPSSGMLRCVAFVRTDVSDELSASIIWVTRVVELRTLVITSNRRTLRRIS